MKKRDRTRSRPSVLTPKEMERRDRQRAAAIKWQGMPPGMTEALAQKFEKHLGEGKTITDLTTPKSGSFLVPSSRFHKHCELNPIWSEHVTRLSRASVSKKSKLTSAKGNATKKFCLKGLHRMTKANVLVDKDGGRRCRACCYIAMAGKPLTPEIVERIKEAILGGASFGQICQGKPVGGGPTDRSLYIVTAAKLRRQRKIDPEFDAFVNKHFASSNSIGQILRHNRDLPEEFKPTVIAVARLKHKIKATGSIKSSVRTRPCTSSPEMAPIWNASTTQLAPRGNACGISTIFGRIMIWPSRRDLRWTPDEDDLLRELARSGEAPEKYPGA
jgi:hypothetical protein